METYAADESAINKRKITPKHQTRTMPILSNPRHEAFARAIFATTCDPKLYPTHGHAYNAAGYRARDAGKAGGSAEVNACNLLKKTKIAARVRELQEEAAERTGESADKCVQELNQLRKDAQSDKAYGAAVAAVMGKAKILNLVVDQHSLVPAQDFSTANSMHEIGKRLLQSIGFTEPDDASIQAAIEANDAFIARLETIRDNAKGRTIDLQK
jgi:terminase small subunit-like protein